MKFPHISAYPWSVDLRLLWNRRLTLESNDKLGWPVPVPVKVRSHIVPVEAGRDGKLVLPGFGKRRS